MKLHLPLLLLAAAAAAQNLTQHVNVFFGTKNGGNMFPGVVAGPFAMVKLGPDLNGGDNAKSGYLASGKITGFSMMHESGTGGAPKYGVVSQLPLVGTIANPLVDVSVTRSAPDAGSVGYYKSSLSNGVVAELAATPHVGFFQYTFPPGQAANVLVDVSHYLPSNRNQNFAQTYTKGDLQYFPDGHYEGSGTYHGGWNLSPDWTVYFCGRFNGTMTSAQAFAGTNETLSQFGTNTLVSSTERVGALFGFGGSVVTSRVGISFISSAKACQYVDTETPAGTTLKYLVDQSTAVWNKDVLSKITTTESNATVLTQLYSALYGMHLLPSNRTGENPNPQWNSAEPYYDDIYTFWDLFRCTTSMFHVLQPVAYEELLRSIVEVYRTDGYLPDARSSNFNGRTQGGSNADNILADAYVKGVRGQLNWTDAYDAMVKDAEVTPPNNHDPAAPDSSTQQGRGALPDWLKLGYITTKFTRSVSRAVEYSANDFALYQVAKGLGRPSAEVQKYLARSRGWRNHWDPTSTSFNTSGFLVPRTPDGKFVRQNPMKCNGCYWGDPYYEGKPWEYTVNVHHDMAALVNLGFGKDAFFQRLSTLMDPQRRIFEPGNEPDFGTPYLYNFINRQAESVKQARFVAKTQYNAGMGGLPGNSDAGAMQSWLLWNMIGLYPLTGQTTFLIHSPWFADLTMDLGSGKSLKVTSTGGSDDAIFVQSLKVNGRPWSKNWLTWNDVFATGGTLDFVLGPEMTQWDTGPPPPSPASLADDGSKQRQKGYLDSKPKYAPAQNHERRHRKMVALYVGIAFSVLVLCCAVGTAWWLCLGSRRRRAGRDAERNGAGAAGPDDDRLPEIDVLPSFIARDVVGTKPAALDGMESRGDSVSSSSARSSAESKSAKGGAETEQAETKPL